MVLYCKTGVRSAEVLAIVHGAGLADAVHVGGGVSAWVSQIDPASPRTDLPALARFRTYTCETLQLSVRNFVGQCQIRTYTFETAQAARSKQKAPVRSA